MKTCFVLPMCGVPTLLLSFASAQTPEAESPKKQEAENVKSWLIQIYCVI
jgi:hypothetical protein